MSSSEFYNNKDMGKINLRMSVCCFIFLRILMFECVLVSACMGVFNAFVDRD